LFFWNSTKSSRNNLIGFGMPAHGERARGTALAQCMRGAPGKNPSADPAPPGSFSDHGDRQHRGFAAVRLLRRAAARPAIGVVAACNRRRRPHRGRRLRCGRCLWWCAGRHLLLGGECGLCGAARVTARAGADGARVACRCSSCRRPVRPSSRRCPARPNSWSSPRRSRPSWPTWHLPPSLSARLPMPACPPCSRLCRAGRMRRFRT